MALEMIEDQPDLNAIITPVGAGTNCAGVATVIKSLNPQTQVIAVQAENAPSVYMSWKSGKIVKDIMETAAEGLATQVGYELTQDILQDYLSDFVLVSEEEMIQAILLIMELVRNMAEEAGAASLAAALKIKERVSGKKVAVVLTGGNISMGRLQQLFS